MIIGKRIFFLLLVSPGLALGALAEELVPPVPGFEWLAEHWDEPDEFKKEPIVVSLGGNCAAARHFQAHKLSEAYMPFDWSFSEFESIYLALHDDFKGFLENISVKSSGEVNHEVVDETYNIRFVHEFKNLDQNIDPANTRVALYDYHENKAKYERRINRLRKALRSKKKLFFFRTVITKQDALLLRDLISSRYPQLNYILVVMNNTDDFKTPWDEKNIKNFYISNPTSASVTEEMQKEWDPIFRELNLIK